MKFLKNGYKEIYNSKREGNLHLYGTKTLPQASDLALTYINENGDELTAEDIKNIKLVYSRQSNGENHVYYSFKTIPTPDDLRFAGFSDEELVFGDEDIEPGEKYEVTVDVPANCEVTGAGRYAAGKEVTITIKPKAGYVFVGTPTCSVCDLTKKGDTYSGTFVMGDAAVEVTFEGAETKKKPQPVKTADVYFFCGPEIATAIADGWPSKNLSGAKEAEYDYASSAASKDKFYLGVAIKKSLGDIVQVSENGDPFASTKAEVEEKFNISTVNYKGTAYKLYVYPEICAAIEPGDMDKFIYYLS